MHFGSFGATYGETGTGGPAHNGQLEERNNNLVYSVRKVVPSYTGYAMRIRRSSDDAEADISYDSSNKISASSVATLVADGSTSTLGTFTSSTDAFVTVWYNQCKNVNKSITGVSSNVVQFNTNHQLVLSDADWEITATVNGTGTQGNAVTFLSAEDGSSDKISITGNNLVRGGGVTFNVNGSTVLNSKRFNQINDGNNHIISLTRSGSTIACRVSDTTANITGFSGAINITDTIKLFGTVSQNATILLNCTNFTISQGGNTLFDINDSVIYHMTANSVSAQPKIVSSGSLITNSNSDVALHFDNEGVTTSGGNFLSCDTFAPALRDENTGFLAYAEGDASSTSGAIDPVFGQYQSSGGTTVAGSFYIGANSDGFSAFQQSSTDGIDLNSDKVINRPTIFGMGKPNSSSGTATFFYTDATDGLLAEATDTFNQTIASQYTGIAHINGSSFFDGKISEVIGLYNGSTDETRRAFNEQRNYWGI